MTTLHLRTSRGRSRLRRIFLLILFALECFALAPTPNAFGVSPAPDGGYAGGTTAEGTNALFSLTTGFGNTANGYTALYHNTTGASNTATGFDALHSNNGTDNTATGFNALGSNTTGNWNTATGTLALFYNNGSANTATGFEALYKDTTGTDNTAIGYQALQNNTTAHGNTAIGTQALEKNTIGYSNTAIGSVALYGNTTGYDNIALGLSAGSAVTTGHNNIDIGNPGLSGDSNTIRIGVSQKVYIQGIEGFNASGGQPVFILNGQLGYGPICPPDSCTASSERLKDNIKPMDKVSEAILALKPVTFRYKKEFDPKGVPQFGLVAEDVQKVNPDLVVRDPHGKPYGVRYEAVNAMLLNEFLKEHRKVQELKSTATAQEATITQLKSTVAQQQKDFQATTARQEKEFESKLAEQQKQIKALTSGLEKVNNQLEMSKPAPQTVLNNR
jgi:uncharacterized coiled-coil protein SlyX